MTDILYLSIKTRSSVCMNIHVGKLAENVASAVARDILYANLKHIRAYGYRILALVHDEVITEAPAVDKFNAANLSSFLKNKPVMGN